MTRGEDFIRKGKRKRNDCSVLSKLAWSDLITKSNILELLDNCPKCDCQKLINLTPKQYMLEGRSVQSKLQKIFKEHKLLGTNFLSSQLLQLHSF